MIYSLSEDLLDYWVLFLFQMYFLTDVYEVSLLPPSSSNPSALSPMNLEKYFTNKR